MKTLYIFTLAFFAFLRVYSQSRFGLTTGYLNGFAKAVSFGEKSTDSESCFCNGLNIFL